MFNDKINAYLDFELTRKLESFVINALPDQSHQSDFNMLYMANLEIDEADGVRYQKSVVSEDSMFVSISNEFGHIDFDMIKTIHIAGVLESDFEVMEYYPSAVNMKLFANYYEGNEVPPGGGYLHVAICPFGVNKVELLNGDIIHIYGTGKYRITSEQRGFKGYKQIPRVNEVLSNNYFKILKLAIYTRYEQYGYRKYSLNFFSPTMSVVKDPVVGQMDINDSKLIYYSTNDVIKDTETSIQNIVDKKTGNLFPVSASIGSESNLFGIGKMVKIDRSGFIDLSEIGAELGDEFSVHTNFTVNEYAPRGSVLFEMGYGLTDVGYQTHHMTLWLNKDGEVTYNCQYSDEWISTGVVLEKDFEHCLTYTIENQRYDEEDEDEYMAFIHLNGKQIWPAERMITPTEKIYLWRAMEAYRTFTEVCMMLPAPHPINGGLDAKDVCSKKLLHESGFLTLENLGNIYKLYLARPKASDADLGDIVLSSTEDTTVKKIFFGQDSEKDIFDPEYFFDGQFSEIAIMSPGMKRDEIEQLHLINITKSSSIKD